MCEDVPRNCELSMWQCLRALPDKCDCVRQSWQCLGGCSTEPLGILCAERARSLQCGDIGCPPLPLSETTESGIGWVIVLSIFAATMIGCGIAAGYILYTRGHHKKVFGFLGDRMRNATDVMLSSDKAVHMKSDKSTVQQHIPEHAELPELLHTRAVTAEFAERIDAMRPKSPSREKDDPKPFFDPDMLDPDSPQFSPKDYVLHLTQADPGEEEFSDEARELAIKLQLLEEFIAQQKGELHNVDFEPEEPTDVRPAEWSPTREPPFVPARGHSEPHNVNHPFAQPNRSNPIQYFFPQPTTAKTQSSSSFKFPFAATPVRTPKTELYSPVVARSQSRKRNVSLEQEEFDFL